MTVRFLYVCECLYVYLCTTCIPGTLWAGRGCPIPCNWCYRVMGLEPRIFSRASDGIPFRSFLLVSTSSVTSILKEHCPQWLLRRVSELRTGETWCWIVPMSMYYFSFYQKRWRRIIKFESIFSTSFGGSLNILTQLVLECSTPCAACPSLSSSIWARRDYCCQ